MQAHSDEEAKKRSMAKLAKRQLAGQYAVPSYLSPPPDAVVQRVSVRSGAMGTPLHGRPQSSVLGQGKSLSGSRSRPVISDLNSSDEEDEAPTAAGASAMADDDADGGMDAADDNDNDDEAAAAAAAAVEASMDDAGSDAAATAAAPASKREFLRSTHGS